MQNDHVSIGDWILTLIVSGIPFLGIIMLFVWAFSDGTAPSKKNYCRAILIMTGIVLALYLILIILGVGVMSSMAYAPAALAFLI